MSEQRVCVGCGGVLAPGEEADLILEGVVNKKGSLVDASEWGWLHRACFRRSIRSPEAALEELRSLMRDYEKT